jgi:putative transposase
MYSYEDRIRAVKLYIKLGKRIAATIRQLGYSSPGLWWRPEERTLPL